MTNDEIDAYWAMADKISDKIVDLINEERLNPGFNPVQMMAGQMLALAGFMRTSPPPFRPRVVNKVLDAIDRCLAEMLDQTKKGNL